MQYSQPSFSEWEENFSPAYMGKEDRYVLLFCRSLLNSITAGILPAHTVLASTDGTLPEELRSARDTGQVL